jgi:hypothetical protein
MAVDLTDVSEFTSPIRSPEPGLDEDIWGAILKDDGLQRLANRTRWLKNRLREGTLAARPLATAVDAGTIYIVTDSTPPNAIYRSDGTNWVRLDAVPDISVHVTHSVAQSIATNTGTILAFDTERYDTDGMHDTATNNTRLTAKSPGKYLVWGGVGFATSTTGYRQSHIVKNGALGLLALRIASLADSYLSIATITTLAVGDYVELQVRQTSGGALDVLKNAGETTPEFGMARIAP